MVSSALYSHFRCICGLNSPLCRRVNMVRIAQCQRKWMNKKRNTNFFARIQLTLSIHTNDSERTDVRTCVCVRARARVSAHLHMARCNTCQTKPETLYAKDKSGAHTPTHIATYGRMHFACRGTRSGCVSFGGRETEGGRGVLDDETKCNRVDQTMSSAFHRAGGVRQNESENPPKPNALNE